MKVKIYGHPHSESDRKNSTLVIEPFGDHAMFRNDNKHGAVQSNSKITNDEEDDDDDYQLPITIPTISKAKPPVYSEWIDWCEIKIKNKANVGVKRDVTGKLKNKDIRKKFMLEVTMIWCL